MGKIHIPKLCRNKTRNRAYVRRAGKKIYLGKWGAPETEAAYRLYVHELTAGIPPTAVVGEETTTVADLAQRFMLNRANYYVKNGVQTGQLYRFKQALEYPIKLFGDTPAKDFGPRKLLECRSLMEESGRFCREYLNSLVNCIRAVFRFGVEWELLPPDTLVGLQSVTPLKRGRSMAREQPPIEPVPAADVERTCAKLSPVVAAMVRLQRATGMRPCEVCAMRVGDIATTADGALMIYTMRTDKTDYRRAVGQRKKIPIGPRAQAILTPYLAEKEGNPDAFLFSPKDAARDQAFERRRLRVAPITKQTIERDRKRRTGENVRDYYDVASYRRAIYRAAEAAGVPQWAPNRLRHLYATEIRAKYGLEASQLMLGHANANVTQIYAERDFGKMIEIARKEG